MVAFAKNWFAVTANPVGVDFGTECLRLAQVERVGIEYRLIAAASRPVPMAIRINPAARLTFLAQALRELWVEGNFRGRSAVFVLPAASVFVQHVRLPKMDDASMNRALQWETQGKFPFDPSQAIVRQLVVGDVYHEQETRSEVIVFAAARQSVDQLIAAADMARIHLAGMIVEPQALIECFTGIHHRRVDAESTQCLLDIGSTTSRVAITRGGQLLLARKLAIAGESLPVSPKTDDPTIARVVEELELCRRYHDTTFPDHPVQKLVFVGGAGRRRDVCEQIARGAGLTAQIGDPLVRMARTTAVGIESGIDRRMPQPGWVVAVGSSMGAARRQSQ